MSEQNEKKPPPFYCPKCGQKHRADLSKLQGQSGAVLKTTCAGCAIALEVMLDEDDLPECTALEEALGESPEAEEKPTAPIPKSRRGKTAKHEHKPR